MRKIFKIIIAIFAVLIIAVAAFGAVIILDVAAYTATGSETLTPQVIKGNALVVYDPGLSGAAKGVAQKVAVNLQTQGYIVILAGIKSGAASLTSGRDHYSIIVVGGPIYAGTPTASVKDFLGNLRPDSGAKVGVFGSGSGATTPEDVAQIVNSTSTLQPGGLLVNAVVVKIGQGEDINARVADFVDQLVK